ncbi:heterokaryon incompatibility protein-domain-containing protein, partial [Lasiosphaeria hispida]
MAGSELRPKSGRATDAYDYSPLSEHGNIRLIRLMGHKDKGAPIQCQLFEYPLQEPGQGAHLYEALSYVWGSEEDNQPICIQEPDGKGDTFLAPRRLYVTQNLYAALLHIRNRLLDRVLWIDAICINQEDNKEKEQQVQFMAKIYASANRVIVWLGEASSDTDGAFEALCKYATKEQISSSTPRPVLALLERPWFRRIWVLQEVAVARQILIKCGPDEVDGLVFCSGLDASKLPYDTYPDLRTLVPPITYLIRHVTFWPQSRTSHPDVPHSLAIRPLGQLADMYHTREAKNLVDKVYALLGIGFCDPTKLSADYEATWEVVFEKLIKLSLSDQVSVGVWGDKRGVAVIRGKGRVLGMVSSIRVDDTRGDIQHIGITWKNAHGGFDTGGHRESLFPLQASAKAVHKGDAICLLKGAVEPTIIRLCNDYSVIIMIQASLARTDSKWSEQIPASPTDLVLVWDW